MIGSSARLKEYGFNEATRTQRFAFVRAVAEIFANPLVIILLIASLISFFVGETVNSAIIATMVLVSVAHLFRPSQGLSSF